MTETVSNVFDVACPSPLKLQEISSLAIVESLWIENYILYLDKRRKIAPSSILNWTSSVVLEKELPNMPEWIYDLLKKYITPKSGDSFVNWLCKHSFKVFRVRCADGWFSPDSWQWILLSFAVHDFALDWNGTIHEVRTAKLLLLRDRHRVEIQEKFRLACLYCFEDDIRRIWPTVCTEINLDELGFEFYPHVYYWTCLLRNALHKIPNPHNEPIDEMMLYKCESKNYSGALYFWNRIPLERQSQTLILDISNKHPELFSRFILPKLNESQFVEFLARGGEHLIRTQLIDNERGDRDLVLPIWAYIRNKIDEGTFTSLIENLLLAETKYFEPEERLKYQSEVSLCCEIWNSAAQSLKQSVFDNLLLKDKPFLGSQFPTVPRETRFLTTVLSDASFEERSKFWSKHWPSLILGTCVEDLLEIMKLCFRNEKEINLFKENTLFKYENIRSYFKFILGRDYRSPDFSDVNRFLSFCNSDAMKRTEMKQRFLQDPYNGVFDLSSQSGEKLANEFLNDTV